MCCALSLHWSPRMAGRPKTRAKRAAEALEGEIPNATTTPNAPPRTAPPRTHARAAPPGLRAAPPLGSQARGELDSIHADTIRHLAAQLQPGMLVRIARVRPSWAAGWIEDYPLDSDDIAELYEYLQEEHGGKLYRAQLLASDGKPFFDAKIQIAGAPRLRGKVVPREHWEDGGNTVTTAAAPAPSQTGIGDMLQLFQMVLGQQQENAASRERTILETVKTARSETRDVLRALAEQRNPGGNLLEQLQEFGAVRKGVEKMSEALAPRGQQEPEDGMQGALKEAASHFLMNAIASRGSANRRPQPPRQRPKPRRGKIPDAIT